MTNILPLLFTLFISFNQIYGNNVTTPTTTEPGTSTTKIYTSMFVTPIDITDSAEMPMCDFEYGPQEVHDGEGIDITICGYKNKVEITFDVPLERWVGFGFILPGNYQENNKMANAYTLVIPAYSRAIQERYMISNGNHGNLLQSTIEIDSDEYRDQRRMITIIRNASISIDALSVDNKADWNKYFNFTKFSQCDETIKIIYAFAKLDYGGWEEGHGTNAGVVNAELTERGGEMCKEGTDGDMRNTPLSIMCIVIISIIAILFN